MIHKRLAKYILSKYDKWLFSSYYLNSSVLSIYRIIYCLFIILIVGLPNWTKVGYFSNDLFYPPRFSIAFFFSSFPSPNLFFILSLIVAILYVLLLFGFKTRIISILLPILFFFGNSFKYSQGKIDHKDLLIILLPLIMFFTSWGDKYSIDSKSNKAQNSVDTIWPLSLLVLIIGFAFFSAGFLKLMGGWLDLSTHAVKGHLYTTYHEIGWHGILAPMLIKLNNSIFWECLDYLTIIFEIGFLISIMNATLFRAYIFAAVFFHLFIYLTFRIDFYQNLIVYMLFMNWNCITYNNKFNELGSKLLKFINIKYLLICLILIIFYYINFEISPLKLLFNAIKIDASLSILVIGTIFALLNLICYVKKLLN